MDFKKFKEDILVDALVLTDRMRAFSRMQKESWQLVPWLALHAYARNNRADNQQYDSAFRKGFWMIKASINGDILGSYTVAVDCSTGELCCGSRRGEPADDADLLRCAHRLDEFDASEVIARLREDAMIHNSQNSDERDLFCARMAERLGLKEIYTR